VFVIRFFALRTHHLLLQIAPHFIFENLFKRVIVWQDVTAVEAVTSGAFGAISRGMYRGHRVAVKRPLLQGDGLRSDALTCAELVNEALLMKSLRHENIVRLYGVIATPTLALVMQYCAGGDLWSFLSARPLSAVSSVLRRAIARDVARGMQFMHSQRPAIVHRDLRPPNVFLAQVGDFGLARSASGWLVEPLESWSWMAPETRGSHVRYDEKADLYSFAMVLFSMLTHSLPFSEYDDNDVWRLQEEIIHSHLRPTLPAFKDDDDLLLIDLIRDCWHTDAVKRPAFDAILQRL
jgi:serine/threonine protein kinase